MNCGMIATTTALLLTLAATPAPASTTRLHRAHARPFGAAADAGADAGDDDAGPPCAANYEGGPVVSNPKVVLVFWSSAVDETAECVLPGFYASIMGSPYLGWLSEYSTAGLEGINDGGSTEQTLGAGSFGGAYVITPTLNGGVPLAVVTEVQLQTELSAQIAAGNLPPPELDAKGYVNTIYAIQMPSTTNVSLASNGTTCTDFCTFHEVMTVSGHDVAYTVTPGMPEGSACATMCGPGAGSESGALTFSHTYELLDAITEPDVQGGWYDDFSSRCGDYGPIASMCDRAGGLSVAEGAYGYMVAPGWSDEQGKCVVGPAGLDAGGGWDAAIPTTCTPTFVDAGGGDAGDDDGGSREDAGVPLPTDAGISLDATVAPTGSDAAVDGASGGDAATDGSPSSPGGCSCGVARSPAGSPLTFGLAGAIVGLLAGRRRRRCRSAARPSRR
jgi:MYXO-CTERM domain-containing protein